MLTSNNITPIIMLGTIIPGVYQTLTISSQKENTLLSFDESKPSNFNSDINYYLNKTIISRLGLLKENWNGYGAKPFNKDLVKLFNDLIDSLPIQPALSPTGRESLILDYELNKNISIAFEIFIDKVDFAYVDAENINKCFENEITIKDIVPLVKTYYGLL